MIGNKKKNQKYFLKFYNNNFPTTVKKFTYGDNNYRVGVDFKSISQGLFRILPRVISKIELSMLNIRRKDFQHIILSGSLCESINFYM